MDLQQGFNIAITMLGFLAAFVLKIMWDKIEKEREGRATLEKELAGSYVRRDDFLSHVSKVEAALLRIEEKLSGNQPRPARARR